MFLILMVAGNLFGSDVEKLGAEDWAIREAATDRLKLGGPFSLPAVIGALESPDPEIRFRARVIAGKWVSLLKDLRAADWLSDPWPLTYAQALTFWHDEGLRYRVRRVAEANGCQDWYTWPLTCDPGFNPFGWDWAKWAMASDALQKCRRSLGTAAGWPF